MKNLNLIYNKFLETKKICIDSRKDCQNSIFFAIQGDNFNGNKYASEAIKKGAVLAIIDDKKYIKNKKYVLVKNSLKCLQQLAKLHKKKSNFKVIAITGTNGKTTTKEIIYNILKSKFQVSATKGNLNNHIGVPLTILSAINTKQKFLIVEMGANHKNEIKKLCEIADPEYGIITNIGKAHLKGFKSEKNILIAKKELYDYIKKIKGRIFINKSDIKLNKISKNINKIYYNSENIILNKITNNPFLTIELIINNNIHKIKTKFIGEYNVNNILAGICVGDFFNINMKKILKSITEYKPKINRSQLIKTSKKNTIILDAYNANPTSMHASIHSFNKIKTRKGKIVIIGDMMELGDATKKEHFNVIEKAEKMNLENIILCGEIFSNLNKKLHSFKRKDDLESFLKKNEMKNKMILIKGSRKMKLEDLTKLL